MENNIQHAIWEDARPYSDRAQAMFDNAKLTKNPGQMKTAATFYKLSIRRDIDERIKWIQTTKLSKMEKQERIEGLIKELEVKENSLLRLVTPSEVSEKERCEYMQSESREKIHFAAQWVKQKTKRIFSPSHSLPAQRQIA